MTKGIKKVVCNKQTGDITKTLIKGAGIAITALAASGKKNSNALLKNINTIVTSTKQINDVINARKSQILELKNRNKIALEKERKRGNRNAIIAGCVGITAGCAAGYALTKAYDITRSDMVYTNSANGESFEDNKTHEPVEIPEVPITNKKFVSVGDNTIMSEDGSTTVIHPNHEKE